LSFQLRADDELSLLTRDSVPAYQQDYTSGAATLRALLDRGDVGSLPAAGRQLAAAKADYATDAALHKGIRIDDAMGDLPQAISVASGSASVSAALDRALTAGLLASQQGFERSMSSATGDLSVVLWPIVVLVVLAGVLIVIGFRPRIGEYR
jgi:hypothetical protein